MTCKSIESKSDEEWLQNWQRMWPYNYFILRLDQHDTGFKTRVVVGTQEVCIVKQRHQWRKLPQLVSWHSETLICCWQRLCAQCCQLGEVFHRDRRTNRCTLRWERKTIRNNWTTHSLNAGMGSRTLHSRPRPGTFEAKAKTKAR
jgi:hypothetical protein